MRKDEYLLESPHSNIEDLAEFACQATDQHWECFHQARVVVLSLFLIDD